jgi:hypothetical protein
MGRPIFGYHIFQSERYIERTFDGYADNHPLQSWTRKDQARA